MPLADGRVIISSNIDPMSMDISLDNGDIMNVIGGRAIVILQVQVEISSLRFGFVVNHWQSLAIGFHWNVCTSQSSLVTVCVTQCDLEMY